MNELIFESIEGISNKLKEEAFTKLVVLVDENTKEHCYSIVKSLLPPHELIEITSGEENKNIQTCLVIWDGLTELQCDRKAFMLNLGGGVITDIGAFCAATYKRGIRFANIPTTLLSQVDASVGGKTGFDYKGFKNHIGLFINPEFVWVDTLFLKTLPKREQRSGFAEMLKHGLIADKNHWEHCKKVGPFRISLDDVKTSVLIKKRVVEKDPKEQGLRKILNFGHTVGHAIETHFLMHQPKLLHGEAIAIGMLLEAFIAKEKAFIDKEELINIKSVILEHYDVPHLPEKEFDSISNYCLQDKKNEGNSINMSLLKHIGEANYNIAVNKEAIHNSLHWLFSKKLAG